MKRPNVAADIWPQALGFFSGSRKLAAAYGMASTLTDEGISFVR